MRGLTRNLYDVLTPQFETGAPHRRTGDTRRPALSEFVWQAQGASYKPQHLLRHPGTLSRPLWFLYKHLASINDAQNSVTITISERVARRVE